MQSAGTGQPLPTTLPDRPTLLYDDGCRFCRAMAEALFRLARREDLALLPWSSEIAQPWLQELEPGVRDASMHLKLPDGTLVSGNPVFAATLGHVRGLKWLAWSAHNVPGAAGFLAGTYGLVARNREILSKFVPYRPPVISKPELR